MGEVKKDYNPGMENDHEALARAVLTHGDGATRHRLVPVTIGMSEAAVFRVTGGAPLYVKAATGPAAAALREEIARTQWLGAQGTPVAAILRVEDQDEGVAMLMKALAGRPADVSTMPTPRLVEALAKATASLHALPAAACPFDETLATRLARADRAVAAGEADPAEFDERNHGIAPADLLRRLRADPPRDEDIAVLHGDLTLGNIVVDDNGTIGFIDCGHAGRGDRYTDLALLHADIVEHRGRAAGKRFLDAYGAVDFDAARARYFLDLYEFF